MLLRKPASIQDRGRKLWAHGNVDLLRDPLLKFFLKCAVLEA
jgi:hypothetical protein